MTKEQLIETCITAAKKDAKLSYKDYFRECI